MSTSAISPSFSEVADFVRGFIGLGDAESITPSTRLGADLGVTGGDGEDLLREAAKRFNSQLAGPDGYITTFGLAQNEYLFGSEGLDLFGFGALVGRLLGQREHIVRDLTVGELHAAICQHKVAAVGAA